MSAVKHAQVPVRFFWNGKEVPEAEYLRRKFCLCGALNASGRLMCASCLKSARAAIVKTFRSS